MSFVVGVSILLLGNGLLECREGDISESSSCNGAAVVLWGR